jgi:hypothetical protein
VITLADNRQFVQVDSTALQFLYCQIGVAVLAIDRND